MNWWISSALHKFPVPATEMILFTALVFFLKEISRRPSLLSLRCQPRVCLWHNHNEKSVHRHINTRRSTLRWLLLMNASPPCFSPSVISHTCTHTHRRIVLHYESRTSYAITSDNNTNDYPLCVVYWLAPECALNRKDVTSLFPRWMNIFGVECWSKHKLVLFLFIPACIAYDYMHEYLPFKSKSLL